MRFSANLSFLFEGVPFVERFARARQSGFTGVEFMWPENEELAAVEEAVADTRLAAGAYLLDTTANELGHA